MNQPHNIVRLGRRRPALIACLTLLVTPLTWAANAKPNIIFIFSDDHALRTIGAYEGSINKTPGIDRIAREGVIFNNSFVGNSICCPSRASILTGKHSAANGIIGNASAWNGQQWVYPREIGKAGYQTALIGKWHLHGDPTDEFQYWEILTGNGGQGSYYNPDFLSSAGITSKPEGYSTDIITDKSIDWLRKRDESKPFFLAVQYKSPHIPRTPAIKDMGSYDDVNFPEPDTLFDDFSTRQPFVDKTFMGLKAFKGDGIGVAPSAEKLALHPEWTPDFLKEMTPDQQAAWHKAYDPRNRERLALKAAGKLNGEAGVRYIYQRYIKDYIRTIDSMDSDITRILNYVDQAGLTENTIIVYSSDQGFFTGEHGWAEKRWMYEESFKTPLVIRWPGVIKPGTKVDALVQNIDLAPTLLTAAGVSVPKEVQGRALQPLLGGSIPADWRKDILYTYYDGGTPEAPGDYNMPRHMGVRDDRYKLIHFYDHNAWELYDLKNDPHELKNCYNSPEYAKEVERLKARLAALKEEYQIPAPPALVPPVPQPPSPPRPHDPEED